MKLRAVGAERSVKAIIAVMAAFACALAFCIAPAYAENDAAADASSAAASEQQPDEGSEHAATDLFMMGNDYVWFGESLELNKQKIDNDIIGAGRAMSVIDCTAAGSIRAAGQDITIDGTTTTENITVAGQHITIRESQANVIAAAGETITVSGTCKELNAYGKKVIINGTVEGDAVVNAETVELGSDARIKGKLNVSAAAEPTKQQGAEVAEVAFQKTEDASEEAADAKEAASGLSTAISVILTVISIVGTALIAVLAEWLFERHTAAAADLVRNRTGITIGTGAIGAIAAPVAFIIMLLLIVTAPLAFAMCLALIALTVVAPGFVGTSLSRLVLPNLGRFKRALAGGAILGVAMVIPILGTIVKLAAFVCMLGYVLQSIYLGLRADRA